MSSWSLTHLDLFPAKTQHRQNSWKGFRCCTRVWSLAGAWCLCDYPCWTNFKSLLKYFIYVKNVFTLFVIYQQQQLVEKCLFGSTYFQSPVRLVRRDGLALLVKQWISLPFGALYRTRSLYSFRFCILNNLLWILYHHRVRIALRHLSFVS